MATPDLAAARSKRLRDVLAPGLDVVFCGVNPGLWSAAVGHHFARPGNRFWKALHLAGLTDRGLTNLVARATATADELGHVELRSGRSALEAKIVARRPATRSTISRRATGSSG